jgi:DNA-binding SARP family transcriptional activator
MPVFELTLLGTFGLNASGAPRPLRSHKAQALLAYLALRPVQAHRRDTLASLLWSRVPTSQARHSLRQTISCIRGALDDVPTPLIVTEADTVRLNTPEVSVDALRFAQLASNASGPDLRPAAAAYVGNLLEGVHLEEPAFDRWLAAEREQLHHRAVGVFSRELQRRIEEGSVDDAITAALCLLALDPALEWVHRT